MTYKGKNGLSRNFYKLKEEFRKVKVAVEVTWGGHDPYTNAWVEACRASPYFMGHVLAIAFPISVLTLGYTIWSLA